MVEIPSSDGFGQFDAWKRNVDRQIAALNTMRRTPYTEFYDADGNLRATFTANGLLVRQADGTDIIAMGTFGDGTGTFEGSALYDANGRSMLMTRDDKGGLIKPDIPAPFTKAGDFFEVTVGSYVTTHQFNPRGVYHDTIRLVVPVGSEATSTGEIRLREVDGGGVTTTLTTTAGAFQYAVFEWLHGRVPGDDAGSQGANFVIEAQRVSGAGSIDVYTPNESTWSNSALVPTADADGNAYWL